MNHNRNKKDFSYGLWRYFLLSIFLFWGTLYVFFRPFSVYGAEKKSEEEIHLEEFHLEAIEQFLNQISGEYPISFSFGELMKEIGKGNLQMVLKQCTELLKNGLFKELKTNVSLIGQVVILAVIGAVFSGFSEIFGSGHVSETGFYVVYLLMMTFLAASFFASVKIAESLTRDLLEFMQVVLPAYFLAVTAAGGALTSAAVCGFTIGAIGVIQSILSNLLIPFTKVYMLLILVGNLYQEDMLSKLTELLGKGILWGMKAIFGIVVGFHMIQGMVLPQADAVKNASAVRLLEMIPGVGGGAGAVSQLVMGSGILIKNTAGAAAVMMLCLMSAIPILKLALLTFLYYLAAAVMQPVCDKRFVSCMTGAAVGHEILLKIVGYSLALLAATIAVICISTNAVW